MAMDFNLNDLQTVKTDRTNFTIRIYKAIEKVADHLVEWADSSFYYNGKRLNETTVSEMFENVSTIVDGLMDAVNNMDNCEYIVDEGKEVIIYEVCKDNDVSFSAIVSGEQIDAAIRKIEQVVDEEVKGGYIPAETRDDTVLNAMRSVCDEIIIRSKKKFPFEIESGADDIFEVCEKKEDIF